MRFIRQRLTAVPSLRNCYIVPSLLIQFTSAHVVNLHRLSLSVLRVSCALFVLFDTTFALRFSLFSPISSGLVSMCSFASSRAPFASADILHKRLRHVSAQSGHWSPPPENVLMLSNPLKFNCCDCNSFPSGFCVKPRGSCACCACCCAMDRTMQASPETQVAGHRRRHHVQMDQAGHRRCVSPHAPLEEAMSTQDGYPQRGVMIQDLVRHALIQCGAQVSQGELCAGIWQGSSVSKAFLPENDKGKGRRMPQSSQSPTWPADPPSAETTEKMEEPMQSVPQLS